jgi:uncharacterized protein (TIGR00255 family)
MIRSMTGFASTTVTLTTPTTSVVATITLKSLNSRFIDITCKMPHALSHLENEIINRCKKALHRGSMYFTIHMSNSNALKTSVVPAPHLVESYLKNLTELQKTFKLPGTITINDIIKLPDLFETTEDIDLSHNEETLYKALENLIQTVTAAREQEGASLQKDLEERMHIIKETITLLEPRAQEINAQRKEHFRKEIQAALSASSPEMQETLLQTLYSNLEKVDVHEELVRLKSHLQNFSMTLQDPQLPQKGKKLDFVLQEMFREINTLSAKLPDVTSGSSIITVKVELEKAREQVQNIV